MWRYLAGGVSALLLVAAGFFFFRSGAKPGQPLFAPQPQAAAGAPVALPSSAPAATERTREQKRFDRYDKDRDSLITRAEYLTSRHKAFAKLDTDRNGQLSFEEWAIATTTKFAKADADHSGAMNPAEFLTTKVVHKTKPKCACPAAKDD